MRILLDTHTLLWALVEPNRLSQTASRAIKSDANNVCVSAASAWEIATKVRIGKMAGAERIEKEFLELMERSGYALLSIHTNHALRAGRLAGDHRDPFDRMIAAQAIAEDIPVISKDSKLDIFGIHRIW
ncbi:MAG: type II toxin-antitoxin system VapC family toxin [Acidobacteriaceae bacterium]